MIVSQYFMYSAHNISLVYNKAKEKVKQKVIKESISLLEVLPWLVLQLGREPRGYRCLGHKKTQPSQHYHSGQFSQYDEHTHRCCLGGQSLSHAVHLGYPDRGLLQRLPQEQDTCQSESWQEPSLAPFAHGPFRKNTEGVFKCAGQRKYIAVFNLFMALAIQNVSWLCT